MSVATALEKPYNWGAVVRVLSFTVIVDDIMIREFRYNSPDTNLNS